MTEITSRLSTALADRYKLERHLGEGGMATVYLAEDLKHKRKVAVKVLRPELAAVLGAERFVQEITTTANLQHPHILPLFDSGEADSFLYYVMPFVERETLRDKLNRETQLGIDEAVGITTDIADALDYAHRHRSSIMATQVLCAGSIQREVSMRVVLSTLAVLFLLSVSPDFIRARAQLPDGVVVLTVDELDWRDSPVGWQLAVLYGDITSNDYSVVRLKMRPNWDAPPHTHERTELEVVRVQSGTMYLAFGEDRSRAAAKAYGPGSFIVYPAGTRLRMFTGDEEVIVEVTHLPVCETKGSEEAAPR